jgi:hypothetical protein
MRQVTSMLFNFFDIKGIVLKEFVLEGQIVNSFMVTATKCAKTSLQTLATKRLAVAS